MNWINIILTVLSSANMVGDLVKNSAMENKAKRIYSKIDEREKELLDRVDMRINKELEHVYSEMNSLKVVVKFLFFISIVLLILFILSLIFIVFILKYKNII